MFVGLLNIHTVVLFVLSAASDYNSHILLNSMQQIHLIYASSSSVYGKHSSIPFHLAADTDHPGNIYAATKRANELMAYQHCMTTGVKSIGLRFFTVYGPWGRPDMAVYKFAQSIVEGKKVPVFKVRY